MVVRGMGCLIKDTFPKLSFWQGSRPKMNPMWYITTFIKTWWIEG